jgi:hypothetical protein
MHMRSRRIMQACMRYICRSVVLAAMEGRRRGPMEIEVVADRHVPPCACRRPAGRPAGRPPVGACVCGTGYRRRAGRPSAARSPLAISTEASMHACVSRTRRVRTCEIFVQHVHRPASS